MRQREDHGELVHQRVWELLPWYVNGGLAERERERVEAHLAACLRCQEEERDCRQMAAAMAKGGEIAPAPHPVQLQRMLARIDESEDESAVRRLLAPLRGLARETPRPARAALLAQAAVILLLVGFGAWSARRPAAVPSNLQPVYRTLSNPAAAPVPSARLRVMFSPRATEKEIRELLHGIHGEITAGPSPSGAYTVEVPAASDPAGVVLARLRSEPQVVMFAEPAAGPGEAGR